MEMTELEQILFNDLRQISRLWCELPIENKVKEVREILSHLGVNKAVPAGVIPERPHNIAEYKQKFRDIFAQMENEHGSCEGVELTKDYPYNRIRCKIVFN